MDMEHVILWLPTIALSVARSAGIFLVAPVFSAAVVPVRIRLMLSVVVALAAVGRLATPAPWPGSVVELALALAWEVLLGGTIGYVARLVFLGVQVGAFHIGQQMGISLGEVYNPLEQGADNPVGVLMGLLAALVFLGVGGHRELISGLLATFDAAPPRSFVSAQGVLNLVVGVLTGSFVLAIKVAGPVLVTLLLVTVAMGLAQKSLPQCHLLSLGMPVQTMAALVVLAAAVALLGPLVDGAMDAAMKSLLTAMENTK